MEFFGMSLHDMTIPHMLGIDIDDQDSRLALADAIEVGLPAKSVAAVAAEVYPGNARFRTLLVPKATLERRLKSKDKRLTKEESERLFRIAEVYSFAETIFGSKDLARAFMTREHAMLDNRRPMDVALATSLGANAVINILGRAAYGGGA
jgi:putative toxin-antitoxin system antitoxin component (TIGR02293 family)